MGLTSNVLSKTIKGSKETMDPPDVQKQFDEAWEQYTDGLITPEEYEEQLTRICSKFDEWVERNE